MMVVLLLGGIRDVIDTISSWVAPKELEMPHTRNDLTRVSVLMDLPGL